MPREVVYDAVDGEVSRSAGRPSDVLDRYGTGGNAEMLIQAVRTHNPRELQAALRKRVNVEATRELTKDDVAEATGVPVDAIHDCKVRGVDSVTYTAADGQGVLYNGTYKLDDPEGTHVSQAEVLTADDSPVKDMIEARQGPPPSADDPRREELDAKERALAKRERELAEAEHALATQKQEVEQAAADAGAATSEASETPVAPSEPGAEGADTSASQPSADGGEQSSGAETVARPDFLPENYDELDVKEAAKAVEALPDEQREQAIAYERATKGRKTITGDAE
jgi:hypothetical protein